MQNRHRQRTRYCFPTTVALLAWLTAWGLMSPLLAGYPTGKHPYFVGNQECAQCHAGAGMGYQQSLWWLSKHAKAYTSLSTPEAKKIARLSGVPVEPQQSPICLGCHSTSAEAEAWEREDSFQLQHGVQCEKCHGAGSEYMDEAVMMDREASLAAGLMIPTKEDCRACHLSKGSHDAVLGPSKFDLEKAWEAIAHPTPRNWSYPKAVPLPTPADPSQPRYTGSHACGQCHGGPESGYQYSRWLRSGHANAYATLATSKAREIARQSGIDGDPMAAAACLKCHTTAYHDPAGGAEASYALFEGVGCEACHGPGSSYSPEPVMRDKQAAMLAGLKTVTHDTCLGCHADAHGKPFDVETAWQQILHPTKLPPPPEEVRYKTPQNMAFHPGGRELYVTCEAADAVAVVDVARQTKIAEIPVGGQPNDVTFHPSGRWAYVSNRLDDTVSVIDVATRKAIATIPVGDEPHGVLTDREGRLLYVLNTSTDSISVIDTQSLKEVKRLEACRNPWALSLSPDGSQILVTNALSRLVPFRQAPLSEVTVIDTQRAVVEDRLQVPGANLMIGVDWHPSGEYGLITMNRTKNLVPMTRLLQGWTITNGLGVVWRDGRVDQVLLDEPTMAFPDPTGVAVTPDGNLALVTSSASNRIAVVDLQQMIGMIRQATDEQRERVLPNHMGKATEFVVKHIETPHCPRSVRIAPDGRTAWVANALDDSLTVIDLQRLDVAGRIDLGGPREITQARYGERLFHSANVTFQRQFSCNSCHPDGHVDGLTYDIEADGLGVNPVDNRTLRGILDTAPFKWEGTNPSLSRQCGARLAVFFTRIQPFNPAELAAVDHYICTIPRPPNRYRPLGTELTEAQRRGRLMFDRTQTNDGRVIPKQDRCVTCHFPPLYTDRQQHDVGTRMRLDTHAVFDTPHLNNIYDSAPYLHNGIAETLEEIWTKYNPDDRHGVTNDMTKDELNDLIEYLKTL